MNTAVLHLHLALAIALVLVFFTGRLQRLRGVSLALAVLLLLTGAHNFMTRMVDAPKGWHMGVGIKTLLALHVISMVFLISRGTGDAAKLARWKRGTAVTLVLTMLIGLYFSNLAR